MTFGERLKQLREAKGLTLVALAGAAGIGLPTLKDYEAGRRSPSLENAQRLATHLGVTCREFDGCEFQHAKQKTGKGVIAPMAKTPPGKPGKTPTARKPALEASPAHDVAEGKPEAKKGERRKPKK